jgi:hypothetical protein
MVPLPDLLTVEEAARLIRVGRTKAYAMAREWRDTGGRSGLPVVDFGHVLRVPRHALEQLVGAELNGSATRQPNVVVLASSPGREPGPLAEDAAHKLLTREATQEAVPAPQTARPASRARRRSQRRVDPATQPTLPFAG